MKKLLFALALPALLLSCQGEGAFKINGSIQGVDGKKAFLQVQDDSLGPKPVDTVKIANGKFEFKGKIAEPALYSIRFESLQGASFFVAEEGNIELKINKDSLNNVKASGTYNNEKMTEFTKQTLPIQKKMMAFQQENQMRIMKAQQTKDTAAMNAIRKDFMVLRDGMSNSGKEFITKNPKSFISLLLIKTRIFNPKADFKEIQSLYNGLDAEVKNTKEGKKVAKKIIEAQKINVGKLAPEFSAPTPEGKTVSLKESMGKITIIDFWASWCGPCRQANPDLVKLYAEYHDKGLNIISVSLDKPGEEAKWKEAIAKDGLTWTQVSNLKEWKDPIAKLYSVEAIPSSFIINAQGIVLAKDLKGSELEGRIAQLLTPPPAAPMGPGMQPNQPQPTK
jgi:thiol-disulfide isomerase/thioredoxin